MAAEVFVLIVVVLVRVGVYPSSIALGTLSGCLPEISEPVRYFPNIPVVVESDKQKGGKEANAYI